MLQNQRRRTVDHSDGCKTCQNADELDRVFVEFEHDFFRVKNRSHELALRCAETCDIEN